jgi:hypothetical protein
MRTVLLALVLTAIACSPPAAQPADEPAEALAAVDLGPYTNSWNSAAFSHFSHTLRASVPGAQTLTLQAQTTSPGGETVAVYPIGPDGERQTARIVFVIATTRGESEDAAVEVPAEGLPVEVIVENASGRPFAGNYTITLTPAAPPAP